MYCVQSASHPFASIRALLQKSVNELAENPQKTQQTKAYFLSLQTFSQAPLLTPEVSRPLL